MVTFSETICKHRILTIHTTFSVIEFPSTFCPHKKEQNCYRETRFCASKYTNNPLAPDPAVGAYSAPPEPQAEFGGRRGKERERRQKEGGEGARVAPPP